MFTPFKHFPDLCLKNHHFFFISQIRASDWKKYPLFAKMGTNMDVHVRFGREGRDQSIVKLTECVY